MVLEDGSGAAMALEDGGGMAALGGGVGWWLKIAAAALGGGGGRRTCNDGVGVSIVKAKGLLLQYQHQHWQGWSERMHPMQGTYIISNGEEIGASWCRWLRCNYNDSVDEARARGQWCRTSTGKARAMQGWHHNQSNKGEGKWLCKGTRR
jgi:hypothetical protein